MTRVGPSSCVRVGVILPSDAAGAVSLTVPNVPYTLNNRFLPAGRVVAHADGPCVLLDIVDAPDAKRNRRRETAHRISPQTPSDTTGVIVHDVPAGRGFHWARRIDPVLPGSLDISVMDGHLLVVNEVPVETYLMGVITAEMSGDAPLELLKAQCIVARSWTGAATERKHAPWGIDLCNDDCCQRYQGVAGVTPSARIAVNETAGQVLVHRDGSIVDANYSKSCGGIVESPGAVWGVEKPGLRSLVDAPAASPVHAFDPVNDGNIGEYVSGPWLATCDAYCSPNVVPAADLPRYLGRVDDGHGRFRWTVSYTADQAETVLHRILFGNGGAGEGVKLDRLYDLRVTRRGRSGRATTLDVVFDDPRGVRQTVTVRGEHRIRECLHESFLYSSAFDVRIHRDDRGWPRRIDLVGAGWGHGAGMCQIGALGMALSEFDHRTILHHYFQDVTLEEDGHRDGV